MNEYLKKIEVKENTEERFKYIDLLLKNNSIDIKSLEDYYAEIEKQQEEIDDLKEYKNQYCELKKDSGY